ncbi:MAG: acyl carrier protein [Deltaproteobacteria bacterium]|nr:acyl carrier protein [Deltaproteobacteria bacterium]
MTEETVTRLLHERLLDDLFFGEPGTIALDDDLFELGLDSMGVTRLVVFAERSLASRIPDAEVVAENFGTLAALVATVLRNR